MRDITYSYFNQCDEPLYDWNGYTYKTQDRVESIDRSKVR